MLFWQRQISRNLYQFPQILSLTYEARDDIISLAIWLFKVLLERRDTMDKMFLRNIGLLTETEQERLAALCVGIAGCGMGSQVAVTLARLGVGILVLVDGDTVEAHNLNRQAYLTGAVGRNKAQALAEIIIGINDRADAEAWECFIIPETAGVFVGAVDIVVDCIDPSPSGLRASLAISEACQKEGKLYLYPLPIGWGGRLYIFSPTGIGLGEFLGITQRELERAEGFPFATLGRAFAPVPSYMVEVFRAMASGELKHYPQAITSTFSTAVLVAVAIVRFLREKTLKEVPDYYTLDPMEAA